MMEFGKDQAATTKEKKMSNDFLLESLSCHFSSLNSSNLQELFPENCNINILDNGVTVKHFIDSKVEEHSSLGSEEPFHVANLDSIFQKHLQWLTNLPRVKPFYAVKCNNTPAVICLLNSLDTGFDCASEGEIQLALSLNVAPDRIIYAHTVKPPSHIRYACAHGIDLMTFDNEDELVKLSQFHAKAKLVLRIAIDDSKSIVRLSPKFGARLAVAEKLLARAAELRLDVVGVSFHVGSGCTDSALFKRAIANARRAFDMAKMKGFRMRLLDIGGGFFGRYNIHGTFEEVSEVINAALDKFFPNQNEVQIIAEPGRYYVDSAFTLAVNVIAKRVDIDDLTGSNNVDQEDCPDQKMTYYVSDGVYGSLNCLLHDAAHSQVLPYLHREVENTERKYRSVIWGPTCDSNDKIVENLWVPQLNVGDWLLMENQGAYTVSAMTNFNGFEKARVYSALTAETWHTLHHAHSSGPFRLPA